MNGRRRVLVTGSRGFLGHHVVHRLADHDLEVVEVPYRGHRGALFRRPYGRLFQEWFPQLEVRDNGFLPRDDGWDDHTWWLFERTDV